MCCLIFRLYLYCGLDEISLLAIWLAQKITRHEKINILSNHLKIKGGRDGARELYCTLKCSATIYICSTVSPFKSRK